MIALADSRLGRWVAALAVMLMALLVVQAPIALVDRLLHDTGQAHAANAFAGAIIDHEAHGHAGAHEEHDAAPSPGSVSDDGSPDPATPNLHHHHHHDSPSVYALPESSSLVVAWTSSPLPFGLEDDLRQGIDAFQQDRPPKALLALVA